MTSAEQREALSARVVFLLELHDCHRLCAAIKEVGFVDFVTRNNDVRPFFVQMRKMESKFVGSVKTWLEPESPIQKFANTLDESRQALAHALCHHVTEQMRQHTESLAEIAGGAKQGGELDERHPRQGCL